MLGVFIGKYLAFILTFSFTRVNIENFDKDKKAKAWCNRNKRAMMTLYTAHLGVEPVLTQEHNLVNLS